jgi:hypothetical protein
MKTLPLLLTIYCALAVLSLGALIILGAVELQSLLRELPGAAQALATAQQAGDRAKLNYDQLAERQRIERGGYDGPQAIRMSYDVQEAQDRLREAREHTAAAQENSDKLQHEIERHQMRFIPLAALLLLHILGIIVFWPWRERRAAKPAD